MKKVHLFLRNYFGFTQIEARGFWAWTVGIALLFAFNFGLSWFDFSETTVSKKEVQQFEEILTNLVENDTVHPRTSTSPAQSFENEKDLNTQGERFAFDPNQATEADLKKLGIPNRFVKSILKFRSKGGSFRKKTDLKKIYDFPENLYISLETYIILPEKNNYAKKTFEKPTSNTPRKKKEITPFDLNTADTTTLSQVRGVGAKTAQAIVDLRTQLGGFISLEQLNEVYFLKNKPELVTAILQYARLDNPQIRKINLNTATIEALKSHPYIGKLGKYLEVCRDKNKFKSLEEVQKLKAITPEIWTKMKAYITVE